MNRRRERTIPAYLLACIVLGGSSQSVWGVLALQIGAILIVAWAFLERGGKTERSGRVLFVLFVLLAALFVLQLIPMPPSLWTRLPGREIVTQGYHTLGQPLPLLPLSETPFDTLTTFLSLLPPLAVLVGILKLRASSERWCAGAILVGTLAAVLLGFMQITTGRSGDSTWYLYSETNLGSAVGFFANRNHMGTLLVIALAFVPPLFFARSTRPADPPLVIAGTTALLVLLVGISMNGSLAAVLLTFPVLVGTAASVPALGRVRGLLASAAGLALIGAVIILASSPVQPKATGETFESFEGRQQIWKVTAGLIRDTFPAGTGFGSFEKSYATAEPLKEVEATYVNHAHNDYLELALEGGVLAILLATAFVVWWAATARRIFASRALSPLGSAATIASGAILAHSIVDYPLRTSAIAAIFAFCVATMAKARSELRRASKRRTEL